MPGVGVNVGGRGVGVNVGGRVDMDEAIVGRNVSVGIISFAPHAATTMLKMAKTMNLHIVRIFLQGCMTFLIYCPMR